jgi:hypothetical protein
LVDLDCSKCSSLSCCDEYVDMWISGDSLTVFLKAMYSYLQSNS